MLHYLPLFCAHYPPPHFPPFVLRVHHRSVSGYAIGTSAGPTAAKAGSAVGTRTAAAGAGTATGLCCIRPTPALLWLRCTTSYFIPLSTDNFITNFPNLVQFPNPTSTGPGPGPQPRSWPAFCANSSLFQPVNITCVHGDCGLPERMYYGYGGVCYGHALGVVAPACDGPGPCRCDLPTGSALDGALYLEVSPGRSGCRGWAGSRAPPEVPDAMAVWALPPTVARARRLCPQGLLTPPRRWCADAPRAAGDSVVCTRLQYVMCGGQWGGMSTVCCRPWPQGDAQAPTFVLSSVALPETVEGYRLYRVDPDDPESGCLKAYAGTQWPWAWDGAISNWTETQRLFNASCPALNRSTPRVLRFQPAALANETTYYATVRVWNSAGGYDERASDGITWRDTPLEGGDVYDGPVPLQDAEGQADPHSLSASWQEFYSFYGPKGYDVCAGTSPDACDVAGPVWVSATSGNASGVVVWSLEVYRHQFTNLSLAPGTRYHVVVTLVDGLDARVTAASDGVVFDPTPPAPGHVYDGRPSDVVDVDFQSGDKLSCWWRGFTDPESEVRFEVAVSNSTDVGAVPVDDWAEVRARLFCQGRA